MRIRILLSLLAVTGLFLIAVLANNPTSNKTVQPLPKAAMLAVNVAPMPNVDTAEVDQGVDVLSYINALNDHPEATPSKDFHGGHVTSRPDHGTITYTNNGFVIDMPGSFNTPSPVVDNGVVYVSGGFGSKQYYAYDATTGERVWAVDLDDDGPSSAAMDQGIMVFNTESCTIFAVDQESGEHLWSYWLGDPLMSMPTIANNMVFTAYPAYYPYNAQQEVMDQFSQSPEMTSIRPSHVLIAMDLHTGAIRWQKWIDGDIMSAPVAEGKDLYVTTFPGTVFHVDQASGTFHSAKAMRATSAPVLTHDLMFISQRTDADGEFATESLANMDKETGTVDFRYNEKDALYLDHATQDQSALKEVAMAEDAGNGFAGGAPTTSGWEAAAENIGQSNVSSLQQFQGSRTLHYEGINYNTMGDELVSTDPKTGEILWKADIEGDLEGSGGYLATPPLEVDGKILIADLNGVITIRDSESGEEIKRFETNEPIRSQPIVWDGWIYATTSTGKLIAINTEDKSLTGWPMWGANSARTNVNAL